MRFPIMPLLLFSTEPPPGPRGSELAPTQTAPATPATTPAPTPAAAIVPDPVRDYVDEAIARLKAENETLRKQLTDHQAAQAAERQAAQIATAAKEHGAKDPAYFGFLAQQEQAAKGKDFNLGAFTAELKKSRADLFTPAAPASTTAGVPSLPADQVTALQAQLAKARQERNATEVLNITTKLQLAGVKV